MADELKVGTQSDGEKKKREIRVKSDLVEAPSGKQSPSRQVAATSAHLKKLIFFSYFARSISAELRSGTVLHTELELSIHTHLSRSSAFIHLSFP